MYGGIDYDRWLEAPYDIGADETHEIICDELSESGCDFEGEIVGYLSGTVGRGNGETFHGACPKCGYEIVCSSKAQSDYDREYDYYHG